jgi:hypothetical protein
MAGFPRMDQQILRRSYKAGQPAVLNPPSVATTSLSMTLALRESAISFGHYSSQRSAVQNKRAPLDTQTRFLDYQEFIL